MSKEGKQRFLESLGPRVGEPRPLEKIFKKSRRVGNHRLEVIVWVLAAISVTALVALLLVVGG